MPISPLTLRQFLRKHAAFAKGCARMVILFMSLCGYTNLCAALSPDYFIFPVKQSSIEIDAFSRNEQLLDVKIKRHCFTERCPIQIGVEFVSERGRSNMKPPDPVKNQHIREHFGTVISAQFPLHMRLKLADKNSRIVFDKTIPPGKLTEFIYGGSTITPLGGTYCLPPGKYATVLQILDARIDLSELKLNLVVLNDFKIRCGMPTQREIDFSNSVNSVW